MSFDLSSAFLQHVLLAFGHIFIFTMSCYKLQKRRMSGVSKATTTPSAAPPESGAWSRRGSLVSRCRIAPVPLGRSGSDRRAFYRVTGADLANLANLRLRAEARSTVFLGVARCYIRHGRY
jgi:hypothetical protein